MFEAHFIRTLVCLEALTPIVAYIPPGHCHHHDFIKHSNNVEQSLQNGMLVANAELLLFPRRSEQNPYLNVHLYLSTIRTPQPRPLRQSVYHKHHKHVVLVR